jgi:hypothetical protein
MNDSTLPGVRGNQCKLILYEHHGLQYEYYGLQNVRFWHEADVAEPPLNVCFLSKSRHHKERGSRPLVTLSGPSRVQQTNMAMKLKS